MRNLLKQLPPQLLATNPMFMFLYVLCDDLWEINKQNKESITIEDVDKIEQSCEDIQKIIDELRRKKDGNDSAARGSN